MKSILVSVMLAAFLFAAEPQELMKPSEVKALVKSARTAAEHRKLVRHYTAMAEKHDAEAKQHEALAAEYTNHPTGQEQKHPMSGETAAHCKFYAKHCQMAAREMRAMAAAHEGMAKK